MRSLSFSAKVAALLLASAHMHASHAGSLWCTGTVVELGVHLPSRLLLRLSSMNDRAVMCNLDSTSTTPGQLGGDTSAAACKSMYANLLAARATGKTVQLMMDGDAVPAQCNAFGGWTYVSLRYVADLP